MKSYLVGGAVRDLMLGKVPKDMDYVVVGATPEDMEASGYKQVGADFPVFLDEYGTEFALARTERKNGKGYHGFAVDFGTDVTLEDDLKRRDFTINAMAMDEDGVVLDYFDGKDDVANKVLRHVDPDGFVEDPVRVLRWARFKARFGNDWTTYSDTLDLMGKMVDEGLLDELTPERVWKEMSRAIMEPNPELFFESLKEVGALKVVFPELHALTEATENPKWHPEGDAFSHTMLVLKQAALFRDNFEDRMAALVHDLGKGLTPKEELPRHYGHEVKGAKLVKEVVGPKYRFPSALTKKLSLVTLYHMNMHRLADLNPKTFVKMFDAMGAVHDTETVYMLFCLGKHDARGRLGSENADVSDKQLLLLALAGYLSVNAEDVLPKDKTFSGQRVKQLLDAARRKAIKERMKQ